MPRGRNELAHHSLLTSHKNQVFQALTRHKLKLEDFEWSECASERTDDLAVPILVHVPTGFFFLFDQNNEKDWVMYTPGSDQTKEQAYPGTWSATMSHVIKWAANLHREITAPDLWDTIKQQKQLAESSLAPSANAPFSPAEQQQIAQAIEQLKIELIAATKATGEKLERIEEQTQYLVDASTRLGRKDYLLLLLGSITSFVIEHTLASDAARRLMSVATQLLGWIGPTVPQIDQ